MATVIMTSINVKPRAKRWAHEVGNAVWRDGRLNMVWPCGINGQAGAGSFWCHAHDVYRPASEELEKKLKKPPIKLATVREIILSAGAGITLATVGASPAPVIRHERCPP
jgi:hypothetical protein